MLPRVLPALLLATACGAPARAPAPPAAAVADADAEVGAAPDAEPDPGAAPLEPPIAAGGDTYAHAGFRVSVTRVSRDREDLPYQEVELHFAWGDESEITTALDNGITDCEHASATLEPVPALADPRLVMLNVFCERGEDFFTRDLITALVFVGDDDAQPAVLWEGVGRFRNELDVCLSIDVPYFDRAPTGAIRAMRWLEEQRHDDGTLTDPPSCTPEPRRDLVLAEIAVP